MGIVDQRKGQGAKVESERSQPATAARILAAAQELALKRGFRGVTISAIAEKAMVGKGTVYLYWDTKEDLFISLLGRSFLVIVDQLIEGIASDSALVLPPQLCLWLLKTSAQHPLVHALQMRDVDILGALAGDERTHSLVRKHGAAALLEVLLPIWRSHGLVTTAEDPSRQAYALQLLTVGFVETTVRHSGPAATDEEWREGVMADSITILLGMGNISCSVAQATAKVVLEALLAFRASLSARIKNS
ncbi:TetR/AcrR family transcriptional regulator [Sphingobium sp. CFD-2]|uniref:TetR/AcrR family transcriptional regulator n=1 Tax=Sphingobium sp. CFD-2 TaxID=2878542 RepID=UPI00214AE809|nr:helix-turn-helix domain-containing protein [Sphingobium sp. CFD-2]